MNASNFILSSLHKTKEKGLSVSKYKEFSIIDQR